MRKDKNLAINLRKKGATYNEISRRLGIPKSTLSGWLRGVVITKDVKEKMMNNIQKRWIETIREFNKKRAAKVLKEHQKAHQKISKQIKRLSLRELKLIGAALYWAEGYKKSRWTVQFCNSDPEMIKLMMKFFRQACMVPEKKFRISVQIHPNISEKEVKEYWSKIVKIPTKKFNKSITSISRSSKKRRDKLTLPFGTCRITISDVCLVDKLKGWIIGLAKNS